MRVFERERSNIRHHIDTTIILPWDVDGLNKENAYKVKLWLLNDLINEPNKFINPVTIDNL